MIQTHHEKGSQEMVEKLFKASGAVLKPQDQINGFSFSWITSNDTLFILRMVVKYWCHINCVKNELKNTKSNGNTFLKLLLTECNQLDQELLELVINKFKDLPLTDNVLESSVLPQSMNEQLRKAYI